MALSWPNKDPDEILDYQIDWTKRLAEDTLQTSTWIVPTGIINGPFVSSLTAQITTVWLSGGTINESYDILNRVTTAGNRTMDQSVRIKIKAK